jgi:GNAT superfamily N-acetyltransferase
VTGRRWSLTLVREHAEVFARLPSAVHRGAVEAYIRSASHRRLRQEELAMLVEPWTGQEGQAAFYRQIAQADERRAGIATRLCALGRRWVRETGATSIGVDTAAPAEHLVRLYESWGFERRDTTHWDGRTYDSVVMARRL